LHSHEGEGTIGELFCAIRCLDGLLKPILITLSSQAKPTHENIIRLSPPLVISEEQIADALRILKEAIVEVPAAAAGAKKN
jgi:acetylornithine/succinyldiaminopimelate/putrescine aminotransferase